MTLGMETLRPGDLMFTTIAGIPGRLIGLAEKINDPSITWDDARMVQHVGVVVESVKHIEATAHLIADSFNIPVGLLGFGPKIVQAMPGGAVLSNMTPYYWTPDFIYVRPRYTVTSADRLYGSDMSEDVASAAVRYVGVPYSFLDYAAITGRHVLIKKPTDRTWLDRYVTSTKHMICSQLADQALSDAGFHVFDDGRLPQDVTPAALFRQLLCLPGQFYAPGFYGWRQCGPGTAYGSLTRKGSTL